MCAHPLLSPSATFPAGLHVRDSGCLAAHPPPPGTGLLGKPGSGACPFGLRGVSLWLGGRVPLASGACPSGLRALPAFCSSLPGSQPYSSGYNSPHLTGPSHTLSPGQTVSIFPTHFSDHISVRTSKTKSSKLTQPSSFF